MKVYVASSWRNDRYPLVIAALKDAGHEVYDFRDPPDKTALFNWSDICPAAYPNLHELRDVLRHPVAAKAMQSDFDAMKEAEVVVMALPCGKSAHLELGWAVGAGKKTVILMESYGRAAPELSYRLADHIVDSVAALLVLLAGYEVTK